MSASVVKTNVQAISLSDTSLSVLAESAAKKPSKLNLGCGHKKMADAVNVDITADTNPEVVHDLNCFPWPLPSAQFNEVIATDVVEHLDNIVAVMEEIHRICAAGAIVRIVVPHFSSANAFTDPTHRHYFGYFSFDYFTGEHEHNYYTRARFRTLGRSLIFHPSLINKVVLRLARRWPAQYEQCWAWTFPAWFLYFELEVIKDVALQAPQLECEL
jgi:SAM-dependent methyltransferase